jgi:hypothetical protein
MTTPSPQDPARPNLGAWLKIWTQALLRPTPAGYADLFDEPNDERRTPLAWLVTGGMVAAAVNMINYQAPVEVVALTLICALALFPMVTIVVTVMTARSALWFSRQFGGGGSLDQMLYALAAITAPMSILSAAAYLVPSGNLLAYALSLYWVYLTVLAVKVVTGLRWGQAALASVVFLLFSLLAAGLGLGIALLPGG